MSTFVRQLSRFIDQYKEANAPLDADGARSLYGVVEHEWHALWDLVDDPPLSVSDLPAFMDAKNLKTVGLDDRQMLLEKVLVFMSRTKDCEISKQIQDQVIDLLYKDLPHPPSGYLCSPPPPLSPSSSNCSSGANYAFRTADGSNNNPLLPTLGKAGSPYARSVPSKTMPPRSSLPDAGLVFDTLLKREHFREHPGGISALFFAFADLVIHCIFNTDRRNPAINNASSYLDLSVLYGSSESQVNSVRRNDGTGKLLDDVFADSRLLLMPPASCALLILFCRNHNFIAQRILDINENSNLHNPVPEDPAERQKQDDEIFHRSRLVNCGYFMQVILGDYVGAILGLVRDESDWRLDPLMTIRRQGHEFVPTGEGNVVSIEFNLLYRWHATLSEPDTKWVEDVFGGLFDGEGTTPEKATPKQFMEAAHKHLIPPKDVRQWTFGGLKRVNGRFRDDDLANIIQNATETRAGAFGARGIPEVMKVIETMAIEQSRSWGTCSLNEFRKFLGLKPYSSFKEWNPNEEIHTAAAALYKDIENLELHVGLQAEETKLPGPGAGLCPGYTISRAILADAVSLTRGDRFMTVDFTRMPPLVFFALQEFTDIYFSAHNLTTWGYQDCQYDTQDGSYGGLLTKLLFRTLPDYYPRGSSYAHFPFLQTSWMKKHLSEAKPELCKKYTWDRPSPLPRVTRVDTFKEVQELLADHKTYISAYDSRLWNCIKPALLHDLQRTPEARNTLLSAVEELSTAIFKKSDNNVAELFSKITTDLIMEKSLSFTKDNTFTVDVVKDVINLVPVYWVSHVAGLPLKSKVNPHGLWQGPDIYTRFAEVSQYIYLNFDAADDWKMRELSQASMHEFVRYAEMHMERSFEYDACDQDMLEELWKNYSNSGGVSSTREFTALLISALVPTAALYSQVLAHVVNFYLDEERASAREDIAKLTAVSEGHSHNDKVMDYVYEALCFDPPVIGVFRTAARDTILGDSHPSVCTADTMSLRQPQAPLNYVNALSQGFLTPEFMKATIPQILGTIFNMQSSKRAPGQAGILQRFTTESDGMPRLQYISQAGVVCTLSDSLTVKFSQ
ncbi:hypothetical protein D9613_010597 [Agrocybe pediades]|uniref:Heme peroxidase n=1 Tax=Agrocybe pediades TaxID=84607 RepID=A0A8H4VI47_9AGAR|nr:hypothetical protein D9613_010597 [Agrocybe pediades]